MASSVKSLGEIPTLTLLYKLGRLHSSSTPITAATSKYNDKISLIRTDITKLGVGAIVNAANESLLGGGGVDGAIHRAAGRRLYDECEKLDGCPTGNAKITSAYNLPCDKVIHAVGPVYYSTKRQGKHTSLLQGCYRNSLNLAVENGCKSIAFSALSTGVYGYPSDEAAETAIGEVKKWLDEDESRAAKMERIVFCSFMEKDEKAYEEWIPKLFIPAKDGADDTDEGKTADTESKTKQGSNLPTLPDAPTSEPAEDGQRDVKKLKSGHDMSDILTEKDSVLGFREKSDQPDHHNKHPDAMEGIEKGSAVAPMDDLTRQVEMDHLIEVEQDRGFNQAPGSEKTVDDQERSGKVNKI